MNTIELSAALGQAQVVENLKNFVGVDAQGAAALMTPERLAAVAGGSIEDLKFFRTKFMRSSLASKSDVIEIAKEVVESFKLTDNEKISFSILYDNIGIHHVYGYVYIVGNKSYGLVHVEQRPYVNKIILIEQGVYSVKKDLS